MLHSSPRSREPLMFESLRAAIQDIVQGRVAPQDRRAAINDMKRALVSARLGVDDLKESVEITARKLKTESEQLETVRRRKTLAEGINDTETIELAVKYEAQHGERVAILERKLEVQQAEYDLAQRELEGMMAALRAANAGVGSGAPPSGPSDADLGLPDDRALNSELDSLSRASRRSAADADAEARLAELKRKMGQ